MKRGSIGGAPAVQFKLNTDFFCLTLSIEELLPESLLLSLLCCIFG